MDPRPFATTRLVPLEVQAGSVVYFGSLLVHMSEMNISDRERRALLFSYGPTNQRHLTEILAATMVRGR
jgi:ectoine hydroxylase-related dioxygenase (phytanoyl-CoA dioxygenase family)